MATEPAALPEDAAEPSDAAVMPALETAAESAAAPEVEPWIEPATTVEPAPALEEESPGAWMEQPEQEPVWAPETGDAAETAGTTVPGAPEQISPWESAVQQRADTDADGFAQGEPSGDPPVQADEEPGAFQGDIHL